ncbi:hypothetical protein [Sphingobium lactosutens]|uniref:Uncharacterized protein n=1 Tax=Sphingobium lactosutens DS20 TaxID=1331060 RepID=T0IUB3_9SPHN|nr:hypothetical protein [Sphingobium lactosutens]EQB13264.1 hypothetical protein RLDS_16130 [Sphingobium lactosutens DS20]
MSAEINVAAVFALKAMWRSDTYMSKLLPLEGKLRAIEAAKAGATPTEAMYFGQGYRLPTGWQWSDVARHRARYGTASHLVPVRQASGVVGWGVPIIEGKFLQRPRDIFGNILWPEGTAQ